MAEVIVALAILSFTLIGLLGAGFSAVRGSAMARGNSQAADLLNAELERLRSLEYASLVHVSGDGTLASAPGVSGTPPAFGGEVLDIKPTGAVTPARSSVSVSGTNYTVYRYITIASGSTTTPSGLPTLRRATVRVEWTQGGKRRIRTASTLLTSTRRGLPLPNFRFDYNGTGTKVDGRWTISRTPGSQADFGLRLSNLGARDAWDLTASTGGWTFYKDTNQNGIWDGVTGNAATDEPALTSTGGTAAVDTGLLEPNSPSFFIVASRQTLSTETTNQDTVFTATSAAQPSYPGKQVSTRLVLDGSTSTTPTPTPSATTTPASSVPCTPGSVTKTGSPSLSPAAPHQTFSNLTLKLFNGPGTIDGDSTTHSASTMGSAGSAATGDCNYSTDVQTNLAGRLTSSTSPGRWEYGVTADTNEFRGNALATVWVQCTIASTQEVPNALTFTVASRVGGVDTVRGTATLSSINCTTSDFRPVQTYVYLGEASGNQAAFSLTPSSADRLVLTVSPSQPVRLLYEGPQTEATLVVASK